MAQATHDLRMRLGAQLRRMPLEKLEDRRAGEITTNLLGSVDEHMNYVVTVVNLILTAVVTPLITGVATLFLDWRLGLALLLLFPAIIPLYRRRRPALDAGMRATAQENERLGAEVVEYVQGLPVLRAACCAGAVNERLQQQFETLERVQRQSHRAGAKPNLLSASIFEVGLLAVVACGVLWVVQGTLDPVSLAAVVVVVVRFAEPLATFITYTTIFALIEAALERIELLLAVPPLPQMPATGRPGPAVIRFDNVSFQYAHARTPALRRLSLNLPARGLTALVGPSGSGKTTVTRLLMRYADPQLGTISIGGVDIRSLSAEDLNRMIATVFQDVHLFDDTVLANIRMARPDASDEQVMQAARSAHCLDFIDCLADGWLTRLGDAGSRLSGGERQRISIARALLKDAPIVILDEPTAALDTESELAVQAAVDTLVRERNVIVVAHRLSTIRAADRILVIENGELAQSGTHEGLLAEGGRYRAMWQAQVKINDWHLLEPG